MSLRIPKYMILAEKIPVDSSTLNQKESIPFFCGDCGVDIYSLKELQEPINKSL